MWFAVNVRSFLLDNDVWGARFIDRLAARTHTHMVRITDKNTTARVKLLLHKAMIIFGKVSERERERERAQVLLLMLGSEVVNSTILKTKRSAANLVVFFLCACGLCGNM